MSDWLNWWGGGSLGLVKSDFHFFFPTFLNQLYCLQLFLSFHLQFPGSVCGSDAVAVAAAAAPAANW